MATSTRPEFCTAHGRYRCATCAEAEAAMFEYGLFVWREDGRYPRSEALAVFPTRGRADRAAARRSEENVVVRSMVKLQGAE